ncbi:MAG: UDP-N-acetylglucosamine 1-carboxyvinyltransferase [Endomicrobiia bacterium]|nr:UDP-N-acetylglucosamine 1-carboxyvinyltransferase [Endomicrobiaceae bacterium]MDD3053501.1 UDP-N-acetylglucosamine 1-carboxyvinyltransferase [Endomicrobiaceae bacterium]MDD3922438.1 UDP-N-acetylglucosamine 1-carboxyvinyltransferase [Endomicrobiaceae bacterium]MDD5102029.1 UDP-N-acetylglucosamine 1-carboxyvinyltransferase [Endomicrobiaceae bacterium]
MDKIVVHGGERLHGSIKMSGSKNSALPILFATLLTNDKCKMTNVPDLADIKTTIDFLNFIGKKTSKKLNIVIAEESSKLNHIAPYDLVRKMRASVLVMGPLLARLGKVDVSLPGGCAIGARPIDIHLEAFKKMGATIELKEGYIKIFAEKGLTGADIEFRFASVGATENVLLASVLAKGTTRIINAAKEPEIQDLAVVLNEMGAKVSGAGTAIITIEGVESLSGFCHSIISDRIETATYMIATAMTKGNVTLTNVQPEHLQIVIDKLIESGLEIKISNNEINIKWVKPLKPINIKTEIYPGFPTDIQAQWMALMCLIQGNSIVEETVFENRFLHVCELQRLGANIKIDGKNVYITGVDNLSGAPVMVSDLRAGAALVLAGLCANGKTEISRIYHLDRGYDSLEKKFSKLGANIRRIKE